MKALKLQETSDTPEVTLDKERGRFEFYGTIMPENPKDFFAPILNWFNEYALDPNPETSVIFKLDYFNTAASKKIIDILMTLKTIHESNNKVEICWYYKPADEDMLESGETFQEITHLPFNFISY
ncbi:MAG: hypothetical protein PWR03_2165 [Tenuifilum sp.]|jgi:hypothetical protein|uniref:DUF1987 domain-containing protein n=1 Tax=Tenuifilum sp. TaxID=2760880 RepID=UPI0024AB606D|nr:DUF1987 domain-containing protein [Tenuifilum sp.]MDI3527981.1 hypothetical protein [Tenuifilum sp.]